MSVRFIPALAALTLAFPAMAGPIEKLPGRWTGWGEMVLAGGNVEKVKCVATYFAEPNQGLRHNLRCASNSYSIDAEAKMKVAGRRVSGEWMERKYSTGGAMTGEVNGSGIVVSISGEAFQARMTLETTKCKQSMNISPSGIEIAQIAVKMSKC